MQDKPLTDSEREALHERARSLYDGMFGAGTVGRIAASLANASSGKINSTLQPSVTWTTSGSGSGNR